MTWCRLIGTFPALGLEEATCLVSSGFLWEKFVLRDVSPGAGASRCPCVVPVLGLLGGYGWGCVAVFVYSWCLFVFVYPRNLPVPLPVGLSLCHRLLLSKAHPHLALSLGVNFLSVAVLMCFYVSLL